MRKETAEEGFQSVLRGCHKRHRALSRVRAIVESPPRAYVTVSERAVRGHLRNETTCRVKTSRATYCRATPRPGRRALKGRRLRTEARPAPNHSPPNPSFRAGLPAFIEKIEHFGFVLPSHTTISRAFNYCNHLAVGVSHRRLEWQTFAGIALDVHSGPSPVIV